MDFSTSVTVLAFVLAIPMAIAGNLLTPRAATWWATTSEKRRHRRIAKLEEELRRLKQQSTESKSVTPYKGPKQPLLEFTNFSVVGIGNPQARQMGFNAPEGLAFFVLNAEKRFPTHAYNLKAALTLQSVDGRRIIIEDAPWFQNSSNAPAGSFFKQSVTLGMLDTAGVVCAIKRDSHYSAALYDTESAPKEGQPFSHGDWYIDLRIEGDNVAGEFKGKLQFLPNGATGFTPIK